MLIINIILLIGGKGRTGTMICVWLVEAGVFSTATQSLDYFGNRRTDTNVSKKFQGVSRIFNQYSKISFENLFDTSWYRGVSGLLKLGGQVVMHQNRGGGQNRVLRGHFIGIKM